MAEPVARSEDEETEEEESDDGGDSSDLSGEDSSWVTWFCSLRGNDFFCEVDEDYIQDDFNLTGLSSQVPYYDYALDTVLDMESSHADMLTEEQQDMVDSAAELLYGLIHARFILTQRGLNAMFVKYKDVDFGRCHRVYCQGQPVLPCGQSDTPRKTTVNVYCPRCNDLYFPKSSRQGNIDGAYFGTTFPHLFYMTFANEIPPPAPQVLYVPRVFGFKVHESSPAHIPNSRYEAEVALRGQIAARIKKRRLAIADKHKRERVTSGLFEEGDAGEGGAAGGADSELGRGDAGGGAGGRGGGVVTSAHDAAPAASGGGGGSGLPLRAAADAGVPVPSSASLPAETAVTIGDDAVVEADVPTPQTPADAAGRAEAGAGTGGGVATNGIRASTAPAGASRGTSAAPAAEAQVSAPGASRGAWMATDVGGSGT